MNNKNTKMCFSSQYIAILYQIASILTANAASISLNIYKSTKEIKQSTFQSNLIREVSITEPKSQTFCASLCKRTPNCGAFAVVDSLCKLADKSGIENSGMGNMELVFVSIEEHSQPDSATDTTTEATSNCLWQKDSDGLFEGGAVDVRVGSGHTRESCLQTCINMNDGRNGATFYPASGTCYCFKGVTNTQYSPGYEFVYIDGCT